MLFFFWIDWIFGVYLMYFSRFIKRRADPNDSLILFKTYDHWPLGPWRTDPNEKSSILERLIQMKGWKSYIILKLAGLLSWRVDSNGSLWSLTFGSEWKNLVSLKDWSEWKIERKILFKLAGFFLSWRADPNEKFLRPYFRYLKNFYEPNWLDFLYWRADPNEKIFTTQFSISYSNFIRLLTDFYHEGREGLILMKKFLRSNFRYHTQIL